MIGLVAQNRAEPVLGQGEAQELQRGEGARRSDRLDIGDVLVHRAARAKRIRQRVEIVAAAAARSGMKGLLIGAGAGRRAAKHILRGDHDVDAATLQFDRRAQARRAAAEHQRLAAMHADIDPADPQDLVGRSRGQAPGHFNVGERVEDRLRQFTRHDRFLPQISSLTSAEIIV